MTTETKIGIAKLVAFVIVIVLIGMWFHSVFIDHDSFVKTHFRAQKIRSAAEEAEQAAWKARFPKIGDTVEVNGKKITILKKYYWVYNMTFKVRMEDGSITDVVGQELIDKKPIKEVPPSLPEK